MCGPQAKRKLTHLVIVSALTSTGAYAADTGLAPWLTQMGETGRLHLIVIFSRLRQTNPNPICR